MSFATHTAVDDFATVDISFDTLGSRLTGSVHTPGDPRYDALVSPWNLAVEIRPAAVVDAHTAEDVVEAVRFAAENRLTAGVQATGHGAIPGIVSEGDEKHRPSVRKLFHDLRDGVEFSGDSAVQVHSNSTARVDPAGLGRHEK